MRGMTGREMFVRFYGVGGVVSAAGAGAGVCGLGLRRRPRLRLGFR